jgi:hypothetical protein
MAYVFQYGSNLSTERLDHADRLRGDAKVVGKAVTQAAFKFVFDIWSIADGGRAACDIISGSGRPIWGVVYNIPDFLIERSAAKACDRKSLDAIEGEGSNYERVPIKLNHPNGSPVVEQVITYVGKTRKPGIQTTWDYVRYILLGLKEHDMPLEYRTYVTSQILANNPALLDQMKQHAVNQ